MREIDDAQYRERQREADGNHRIGAADNESVGQLLQEEVHGTSQLSGFV